LSTALRQSWTGFVVHWVYFPMYALGFSTRQVARAGELNLLYQYWVHTETINRLPTVVETVMNTASHHRVHHGVEEQYLDRNYAGILIIWDRLFGTFEPEVERVHYGLTKNIDTFNPLRIAFHEWASLARDVAGADTLADRVGYALGPPGWQPTSLSAGADQDHR
jgi:sterol desaturase/sphingolipid hydroxylase (fatty acid hydroxylase superfamily)